MQITTEDLVSSLLSIGYPKVDSSLFAKARAIVSKRFVFTDPSISKICSNFIFFDGNSFRLNNCSSTDMILNRNTELTNYLKINGLNNSQVTNKPKTRALVMY